MAFYPAHCDNNCKDCSQNNHSGWCIAFDIPIASTAQNPVLNEAITYYPKAENPCEHCTNNPKNNPNASGICHCALPYLCNPIY